MKNKLMIAVFTLLIVTAGLCGCGKKGADNKSVDIHSGVYQNRVVEEMEGSESAYYYYLILNDDGTGTLDAQDTVPVTWDAKSVKTESTDYKTSFNGKVLSLEDNGVAIDYKYLKEITIDEFLQNRDNPEYMFYIEDMAYMLNSFVEEQAGKNSFDSYEDVIANLTSGQGYAYIDVYGHDGKVLIVTDELYDYAEGVKAAMVGTVYVENDGEVTYATVLASDGTARPIALKDGILFEANQHNVAGYFFTPEGDAIMVKFSVFEEYNEEGTAAYSGFVRETNSFEEENENWISSEADYMACYEEYNAASPIEFTVVK